MLLTHFIWQTDLKPLSGTNAKNGAIPLSLTPTIHTSHARCDKASEWVGGVYGVNRCRCVGVRGGRGAGDRTRLMIRPPVQHVCTLVRLNFVY